MALFPSRRALTLEAAVRDLASAPPRARVLAAHALGDVPADERDAARAALVRALDDDRGEVRAEAAASLGALGAGPGDPDDAAVVAALVVRLDDGLPEVRQGAAIALGTLAHADGFAPLVSALRNGAPDLRFQAASSLVEIDRVAAYGPLVASLEDDDAQVLSAIALSLGATADGRAAGHLSRLLEHADPGVTFDAAYALAQLGDRRGRARLYAALGDKDRAWDAAAVLEEVGDRDAIPSLAAALGDRRLQPELGVRAAAALVGLDPTHAAARAHLLAALDHRKLPVRGLAITELARVGGAWALPALAALAGRWRSRDLAPAIADAETAIRSRGDAP